MRNAVLVLCVALLLPVSYAQADVDAGDVATSAGVSASLYSTFKKDKKLVAPSHDDASSFIASGGAIRGAYLEAALKQIRQEHPGLVASDQDLAEAILLQP
ncbi:hypothetical protein AWM79_06350 [Pseudomonas agarici]|uniref:Holliday junction resolvase n=1 Tax=Pseudomonas agarici TaxID=46677 RepID=A0A0X1SZH6_PSEAA|nr:DUF2388 domain-containing protein [Pseudomonas agarici]AMB84949.1 hypothetical protein AWM79_06350 [Pseudomonas agarici]NWB93191.1 DUF2388 domain-containing protein [Pseudomonas agarici]NWC08438.1 DUF2388 domain-containing protein [Pseudomonas agarici]SEK66841.1 conserverd hypothetical protein [Pseudomonas agarici]